MRGRIVRFTGAVVALGDDRPVLDDDRTDRHFAPIGGDSREVEGAAHRFGDREIGHVLSANPLTNLRQADKRAPFPVHPVCSALLAPTGAPPSFGIGRARGGKEWVRTCRSRWSPYN